MTTNKTLDIMTDEEMITYAMFYDCIAEIEIDCDELFNIAYSIDNTNNVLVKMVKHYKTSILNNLHYAMFNSEDCNDCKKTQEKIDAIIWAWRENCLPNLIKRFEPWKED